MVEAAVVPTVEQIVQRADVAAWADEALEAKARSVGHALPVHAAVLRARVHGNGTRAMVPHNVHQPLPLVRAVEREGGRFQQAPGAVLGVLARLRESACERKRERKREKERERERKREKERERERKREPP